MNKLENIKTTIANLIKEMKDFQKLEEWFYTTSKKEISVNNFDSSKWNKVKINWNVLWDADTNYAYFYKKISFPEEIFGIDLSNSKIEGMFFVPLGGEIFVNWKKVAESENWLPEIIFPITENLRQNEEFQILIKIKKGKGWGATFFSRVYIDKLDNIIFQLELFLNLIYLTESIKIWEKNFKKICEKILKEVESILDLNLLEEKKIEKFLPSLKTALKKFDVLEPVAKKYTIHLIGHAHIDMNWLWEWKSTLYTAKGTFKTVNSLMEKYPEFKFSQSQAALYQAIENEFPEVFSLIKKKVLERKWEVTASTWVEGDLNMASGEALIRQILLAKKYIKEKFGIEPRICWCADTFGHPWTYPQILKKSGIDFYYAHRCPPKKEYPLFWWKSPDNSSVLALVTGETYNNKVTPSLCKGLIEVKNRTSSNQYFVSHGVGNHGGGPTLRDIERTYKLQKVKGFPKIKFDFAENYFKEVLKENIKLPVVKNELNTTFEGCYTTHSDIKMMNRTSENLLFSAEVISTINSLLRINKYPAELLEKCWQNTCFNQFHDILCGSGIHQIYQEGEKNAKTLFKETLSILENIIENSLKKFSEKICYKKEGIPILVFNTLSWERKDIVKIEIPETLNRNFVQFSISDEEGKIVASQFNGKEIVFVAEVPAVGYRVYYLKEKEIIKEEDIKVFENGKNIEVENEFFKISFEKNSGCLKKLFLKEIKKEMISKPANLLQIFYEKPHDMSAWNIGPISKIENISSGAKTKIIEKGPVRVVLKVEHKILNSKLAQNIYIYKEIPRIDFSNTLRWKEKGTQTKDAPMLKVSFPLKISEKYGSFEIPFGHIYRPVDGCEYPQLKWVDLSNKNSGVSILNNAKYGCSILKNTIRITLVRSAYEPDPISDVGEHKFSYSIYPHKYSWKKAETIQRGFEFNHPLLVYLEKNKKNKEGILPEKFSFLSIYPPNFMLTALKQSEDRKGIIIRFYEAWGKKAECLISFKFPFKKVFETDLLERKNKKINILKNNVKISSGKFEIKTIKIEK